MLRCQTTCCTHKRSNAKAFALTAHSIETTHMFQHREMVWHWIKQAFAQIPKVQIAFNNMLVHGLLQFTSNNAFSSILHHLLSPDILCKTCFHSTMSSNTYLLTRQHSMRECLTQAQQPWGNTCSLQACSSPHKESQYCMLQVVQMILPQVHLQKPCYDFSFL